MNMERNRSKSSGVSGIRKSSIPKYTLNVAPPSSQKRKSSSEDIVGNRRSADKMNRISLATGKTTPNRAYTPLNNRRPPTNLSSAHSNRQSIETVRSSIGGVGKSKRPAWPQTDNFKWECRTNIETFLLNSGYPTQLTEQSLHAPTTKEFSNIFRFIYKKINPSYTMSPRIEEDAPKLLKGLEYPFQLQRSLFLNVSPPHTWKSILPMLSWLVDQARVMELVDTLSICFPSDLEQQENIQLLRFQTHVDIFNSEDEEVGHIIEDYRSSIQTAHCLEPEGFSHLEEEVQILRGELESLPNSVGQNEQLNLELSNLIEDSEKLGKYNEELHSHLEIKINEIMKLKGNLGDNNSTIKKNQETVENLKQQIKDQDMCTSEIAKFRDEMYYNIDLIKCLKIEESEAKEYVGRCEMSVSKADHCLRNEVYNFNSKAKSLSLNIEELVTTPIEEQTLFWEQNIIPILKNYKKSYHSANLQMNTDLNSERGEFEKLEADVHSLDVEHKKESAKLALIEVEIPNIKKEFRDEEEEMQQKCALDDQHLDANIKEIFKMQSKAAKLREKVQEANLELEKLRDAKTEAKMMHVAKYLHLKEIKNEIMEKRNEFVKNVNRKAEKEMDETLSILKKVCK